MTGAHLLGSLSLLILGAVATTVATLEPDEPQRAPAVETEDELLIPRRRVPVTPVQVEQEQAEESSSNQENQVALSVQSKKYEKRRREQRKRGKHVNGPKRPVEPSVRPAPSFGDRRALYVWNARIPGDKDATQKLLDFAQKRKIAAIFIEASDVGYLVPDAAARYDHFISSAHARKIAVLALSGNPWYTVSPTAGIPGQVTSYLEGWDVYANIAGSGLAFDGVVDNSEPYLNIYLDDAGPHNHFWENTERAAQDYVDFLRGVRERVGSMPFVHTTPFWYDADPRLLLSLDGSIEARPLNEYVQEIVDIANVLDYRDYANGPGGMIEMAKGEMASGRCLIGVETAPLGEAGAPSTFYEEGQHRMERELADVSSAYNRHPNFAGFTIHYYGSYVDMK